MVLKVQFLFILNFYFFVALAQQNPHGVYYDYKEAIKAGKNNVLELTISNSDSIPRLVFEMKNLRRLTIRNGLKQIPKEIGKLSKLEYLYMLENDFNTFPSEIIYCTKLKEIRAVNCKIRDLPKELFEMRALKSLILRNNLIERLPCDFIDNFILKELNLKFNRLILLPNCIQRLYALESFYTNGNKFIFEQADWNNPKAFLNLRTLVMSECNLEDLPNFMTKNVDYLDLSSNKIKIIDISEINKLYNIKFLSLENNPIAIVDEKIFKLKKLQTIQIDKNDVLIELMAQSKNVCLSYAASGLIKKIEDLPSCEKLKKNIQVIFFIKNQ
jgi:Leucine-rich repeat (LRR) protein